MDDMMDAELLGDFISESQQSLKDIEKDLLSLETDGGADKELVNRIFRAVHTIKGNSGYLKLQNIVGVSHRAETLLDKVRSGERAADANVTDAVLAAVDSLSKMLSDEALGVNADVDGVMRQLDLVLGNTNAATAANSKIATVGVNAQGTGTDLSQQVAEAWDGKNDVFEITTSLEHLHSVIDTKEGLLAGLNSLGKVLAASTPLPELDRTSSGVVKLFYQTVMQPDLLHDHFGFSLECIQKYPVSKKGAPSNSESVSSESKKPEKSHVESPAKNQVSDNSSQATAKKTAPGVSNENSAKHAGDTKGAPEATMRVPVHILHELLEWTGTMVMARNQLMNEFNFSGSAAFRTLSQAISGVHETVIETRMQTTGSLFERYRRVVRDLARQLGKEVQLHIEGGDLELDRTILEGFADPLTHLIRNSLDHAVETPDEREAAGKNRQGNIYLRSYIQSGEIILEVQDDGRGISAERVCAKAIEKGVISAEAAASLTESQKLFLIFAPGFSTKDQASDLSGRGVGMDVVRNNIEKVGGTIDLQTRVGQGTTIAAMLPLAKALVSSSLTKALVFDLQGERFAIPETAVSEIIRFDSKTQANVTKVNGQDVYQLRDNLIALVNLAAGLDMESSPRVLTQDTCLVVLQYRKYLFGVVVDNVIGIQEIIVRSTPRILHSCHAYSGHTVLGNGMVAMILDINGLVNKLNLKFTEEVDKKISKGKKEDQGTKGERTSADGIRKKSTRQRMLVFSYAPGEFFAVPLELVAIIKRISLSDIRTIGDREYYQEKQETISLVRLEEFLSIRKLPESTLDCCLIRPTAVSYPLGILTGTDVTVIEVDDSFDTRTDNDSGVIGTFVHNDRLIMLLDLFSIFEKHSPDKVKTEIIKTHQAKILVAEDSLFFRKLIQQYMRRPEWEVEIVTDGLEAYERLRDEPNRFDLVISDINMPRMDGYELATRLREDRRFDRLPLVALTTLSDNHFREKGLSLGFDRYVVKIDKHQVCSTIAECLRIDRQTAGKRE